MRAFLTRDCSQTRSPLLQCRAGPQTQLPSSQALMTVVYMLTICQMKSVNLYKDRVLQIRYLLSPAAKMEKPTLRAWMTRYVKCPAKLASSHFRSFFLAKYWYRCTRGTDPFLQLRNCIDGRFAESISCRQPRQTYICNRIKHQATRQRW